MRNFGEVIYLLCCMALSIIIGAGIHEHVLVWSKWSAAPPVSFTMFEGKYGYDPSEFWPQFHPFAITLCLMTLFFFWKTSRRKFILPVMIIYAIIIVTTFTYFVPTVTSIIKPGSGSVVDPLLKKRADTWEILSMIRIIALIPGTLYLYLGLKYS